jgi:hypothetical protein
MPNDAKQRAAELFNEALEKDDAGDEAGALSLYLESLALHGEQPQALYNVGLIYKYRREWKESMRYNLTASELRPDDQATNWNLGIAATALREWRIARAAWKRAGIKMVESDEPIEGSFGFTPMRLNGFGASEALADVVWATRLSPVTARIENIPLPESRFRFGDVVLHDGAPTGTRLYAPGDERSVFNVFELFEASDFVTFDTELVVQDGGSLEALRALCAADGVELEDWTANVRMLCKACSEGRPHEQHDHVPESDAWVVERRVGLASPDESKVMRVLELWSAQGKGRIVQSVDS